MKSSTSPNIQDLSGSTQYTRVLLLTHDCLMVLKLTVFPKFLSYLCNCFEIISFCESTIYFYTRDFNI